MDCDKAIYRVYGYLDGELTVWRRWTITRHLDECPPCAQGFDFEIELRQVISSEVPRRRAAGAASGASPRRSGAPLPPDDERSGRRLRVAQGRASANYARVVPTRRNRS